ncbi:DUF7408 domain-containing protein [Niallia sp. 01092]|uniref:DUF7408 domain-containing protein n=1 Tax=unclassified Niallia TaxID=2837522 RepID=UPI003FD1C7F3
MLKTSKKAIIVLVLIWLLFSVTEREAFAKKIASDLKITTEAGFDGKIGEGKGYPLTITVENTGKAFKGDLLLPNSPSYEMGGSKVLAIDVPANSQKTYTISLSGLNTENSNNAIRLYKGNWQDGVQASFTGVKNIKANFITDYTLGILSEQYDQYKSLRDLPSNSVKTVELTKEKMPDSSIGLEAINYLLADDFSLSELSELQQKSIHDWIVKGGILITGSKPNSEQDYGDLHSLLPLKASKETTISSTAIHSGNNGNVKDFSISSYETTLTDGSEVISKSKNTPIIAKKKVGNGLIIQTAFSLHDPNLLTSDMYANWFEQLLFSQNTQTLNSQQYSSGFWSDLYYSFFESNEYFKSSNFSILLIIGILLSYLIVVVPVLYFVLKKKDKREYAWWIIPSIAILLSAGLFIVGAKDRIKSSQFNEMGMFKYENNYLTGYYATTLLSKNAGDYTLDFKSSEYTPIPFAGYSNYKKESVTTEKRQMSEIHFTDVEYWSNRTMVGNAIKQLKGGFEPNLNSAEKTITGTIKNNFPYNFSAVYIWSGKDKIKIGSLKAGETKNINAAKNEPYFSAPIDQNSHGYYLGSYKGKDLTEFRAKVLENAVAQNQWIEMNEGSKPIIYGITEDEIISVNLVDDQVKKNKTSIIMQPISLGNHFSGKFTFTEQNLDKKITIMKGAIYSKSVIHDLLVETGEYAYNLQVPNSFDLNKMSFQSLDIQGQRAAGAEFTIYNNETKKYEGINGSFIANKEKVGQYISVKGSIMIRIKKMSSGDPYVSMPPIKLKGEVKE